MQSKAKTVAVVDYGIGNLRSVSQAVSAAAQGEGWNVVVTHEAAVVRDAARVVLPGQGAMPDCMRELEQSGLREAVLEAAAAKPLFGVCVGMQMLLTHSTEGEVDGLNLIPGRVQRFDLAGRRQPDSSRYKVPHMGWNRVRQVSHEAARTRCGKACPTRVFSTSCTAITHSRLTQRMAWVRRITAAPLHRPLHVVTFSLPSFTLKKARPRGCAFTVISCTGIPDVQPGRSTPDPAVIPRPCCSSLPSTSRTVTAYASSKAT